MNKEHAANIKKVSETFEHREQLITSISVWRKKIGDILTLEGDYSKMSKEDYENELITCLKQTGLVPITKSENLLARFLLELFIVYFILI